MTAITKLLKAFGVNIEQQHIDAIEKIVPQVPRLIEQGTTVINSAVQNFDARLKALEEQQKNFHESQLVVIELLKGIAEDGRNRSHDNNTAGNATGNTNGSDNRKHRSNPRSANSRG